MLKESRKSAVLNTLCQYDTCTCQQWHLINYANERLNQTLGICRAESLKAGFLKQVINGLF